MHFDIKKFKSDLPTLKVLTSYYDYAIFKDSVIAENIGTFNYSGKFSGYSTDFEDAELNTVKSLERTGKVRDYLVSQGISKTRFITLGMAESREKTMSKGENRINFKVKFN